MEDTENTLEEEMQSPCCLLQIQIDKNGGLDTSFAWFDEKGLLLLGSLIHKITTTDFLINEISKAELSDPNDLVKLLKHILKLSNTPIISPLEVCKNNE